MGRFQIRFETIMGSVNSIENARCGFEIGLVFESVFKQVEIGLDTGKQKAKSLMTQPFLTFFVIGSCKIAISWT
ncbi:MAG: hypothetical protein ACK2TU_04185 [Anaerolineales bacterium]|jgi:hypothetical protein